MSNGRSRSQKHQNRVPFVAKRDIKRNEGDRERERSLRHLALTGVCKRCRQKVAWRFQMGKYKPKKPGARGKCNACELKTVRLAYRSLCDACGRARLVSGMSTTAERGGGVSRRSGCGKRWDER